MFAGNSHVVRTADPEDEPVLNHLAELDGQRPLTGPALIGTIDDRAVAAISLTDGRLVADPFARTGHVASLLRLRLQGLRAYEQTPSLRRRLRTSLHARPAVATAT